MPDINLNYMGYPKELFLAIYKNDIQLLTALMLDPELKKYVNERVNSQNNHPLYFFAFYGDATEATVRKLFENGADPLKRDDTGRNALLYAANAGDPAILQIVINEMAFKRGQDHHFADEVAKPWPGTTLQNAFHALFTKGCGAGPDRKAKNPDLKACLAILIKNSADPINALNAPDIHGVTPLQYAKAYGMLGIINELLPQIDTDAIMLPDNIQEIIATDFFGRTKLNEAAFTNDKSTVYKEIVAGTNVSLTNKQSRRDPLRLACSRFVDGSEAKENYGDMINLLLSTNLDPLSTDGDPEQRTALHLAANTGSEAAMRALFGAVVDPKQREYLDELDSLVSDKISQEAREANTKKIRDNINARDKYKWTALHVLASNTAYPKARGEAIKLLFEFGINYLAEDADGMTALDIANAKAQVAEDDVRRISRIQKQIVLPHIANFAHNVMQNGQVDRLAGGGFANNAPAITAAIGDQILAGKQLAEFTLILDLVNQNMQAANERVAAYKSLAAQIADCVAKVEAKFPAAKAEAEARAAAKAMEKPGAPMLAARELSLKQAEQRALDTVDVPMPKLKETVKPVRILQRGQKL